MEPWMLRGSSLPVFGFFVPAEVQVQAYLPSILCWDPAVEQPLPPPAGEDWGDVQNQLVLPHLSELLADAAHAQEFEQEQNVPRRAPRRRPRPPAGEMPPVPPPCMRPGSSSDGAPAPAAFVPAPPPLPPPAAVVAVQEGSDTESEGRRRLRTVAQYPRLNAADGPLGSHYLRVVDNPTLGHLDMRAVCGHHKGCTLSRTLNGVAIKSEKSNKARGRPLGVLWHFLEDAVNHDTGVSHKRAFLERTVPQSVRCAARARVKAVPEAGVFLALVKEHPKRPGEESEPEDCP